jgi:hypothetical protein
LTVTWTAVNGATKYQVFYGSSENPTTQYGSDISGTSVGFAVPGNGTWYVRIKAGNSKGYSEYSPDARVTVSGVASVIGSWTRDRDTYKFGENGKLIYTYDSGDGNPFTRYAFYDPAKKEWYWGHNTSYNLTDDSLSIDVNQSFSLTSEDHNGLIGTWTGDGEITVEITAAAITIGSDVYPYYTYTDTSSGGSGTYLVYKDTDEPDGRYALSGGKLQFTSINRTTYERQGSGSGITGTWKITWNADESETWTFNSDGTAEFQEVYNKGEDQNKQNYPSYTVSGSKITLEQEWGTLSGSTFTFIGISFSRTDSGSGIIGTWTGSYNDDGETITINVTITSTELQYTQTRGGQNESGSWPIRISGNSIYRTEELDFKLEGSSLTIIEEYTQEYERVSP